MTPKQRKRDEEAAKEVVSNLIRNHRSDGRLFNELRDEDFFLLGLQHCRSTEVKELEAKLMVAIESLEGYSKCDGYCAPDECVCRVKPAKEALQKIK